MFERFAKCRFEQSHFCHGDRQYIHYTTTLNNAQDAALSVALSWPSGAGELQVQSFTEAMLYVFQPRFVAMSGICAGDRRKVRLGDLIVAEKSFKYDAGKIINDDDGNKVLQSDTDTQGPGLEMLGWLQHFDNWSPLLRKLKRPKVDSTETDIPSEATCHIKAMAAGSAVRADDPFPNIQMPVRTAWAVEMESYAFYLAAANNHLAARSLVVKGVCDYADPMKDDRFHKYAGEASALYLLSFIQQHRDLLFGTQHNHAQLKKTRGNKFTPTSPPAQFIRVTHIGFDIFYKGNWDKFNTSYECAIDLQKCNRKHIASLIKTLDIIHRIHFHIHGMSFLIKIIETNHHLNEKYISSFNDFSNFLADNKTLTDQLNQTFNEAGISACLHYFYICEPPLQHYADSLQNPILTPTNEMLKYTVVVRMFLEKLRHFAKEAVMEIRKAIEITLDSETKHDN